MNETLALMRAHDGLPSVGERVRYTGSDYSTLFFGPGIVKKITGTSAWVRPSVLGDLSLVMPSGGPIKNMDYLFAMERLEVIPREVVDPVQWFKLVCKCGYTSAARPFDEIHTAAMSHTGPSCWARIAPEDGIRCGACIRGNHAEAHAGAGL